MQHLIRGRQRAFIHISKCPFALQNYIIVQFGEILIKKQLWPATLIVGVLNIFHTTLFRG